MDDAHLVGILSGQTKRIVTLCPPKGSAVEVLYGLPNTMHVIMGKLSNSKSGWCGDSTNTRSLGAEQLACLTPANTRCFPSTLMGNHAVTFLDLPPELLTPKDKRIWFGNTLNQLLGAYPPVMAGGTSPGPGLLSKRLNGSVGLGLLDPIAQERIRNALGMKLTANQLSFEVLIQAFDDLTTVPPDKQVAYDSFKRKLGEGYDFTDASATDFLTQLVGAWASHSSTERWDCAHREELTRSQTRCAEKIAILKGDSKILLAHLFAGVFHHIYSEKTQGGWESATPGEQCTPVAFETAYLKAGKQILYDPFVVAAVFGELGNASGKEGVDAMHFNLPNGLASVLCTVLQPSIPTL